MVEVGAFNRIRDDVNGLSVARLAERFVSVIRDVDNGHHSPFERCCVLNQMVLRVSAGGLLRAFDEVLQDNPDGGNEIIDGILSFVCSCESVVELRYNV
ncbi:MAG: hypothetical protein LBD36_02360, partial [Holosporales bacterium]|nr:hypothetical protein [Holosporales bacterium]